MQSQSPVPVVCAIIERGALFLAARRAPGMSNEGLWEFPGGKVHEGESNDAALVREINEELGIIVAPGPGLHISLYTYPWISIKLIPLLCTIVEGEPHPHEHDEVKWVDPATARTLHWAPADIPILNEYIVARAEG
jgi:8-oxo-dGTP diphosphatase